jgi:hypothetical protein
VCHQGLVLEIGRLEAKNKTARYRFVFRMRWTNTAGPCCCYGIFINALFRAYLGISSLLHQSVFILGMACSGRHRQQAIQQHLVI